MAIYGRKRRFYPEFYTEEEIENQDKEHEKSDNKDNINDINNINGINEEDIDENQKTGDININVDSTNDLPEKEKIEEKEEVINYNDLLYPNNININSISKQLDNLQNDFLEKKLITAQESRINNIPNEYMGFADEIIQNENENEAVIINNINNINVNDSNEPNDINDLNNSNKNLIEIEIPDHMYCKDYKESKDDTEVPEIYEDDNVYTEHTDQYNSKNTKNNDISELEKMFCLPELSEKTTTRLENTADYWDKQNDIDDIDEYEEVEKEEKYEKNEKYEDEVELKYKIPEELQIESQEKFMQFTQPDKSEKPELSNNPKFTKFDIENAIQYAQRWALDRNPNFLDFEDLGGDCTNYISQILLAGGCKMDHTPVLGWYYNNGNDKSPSWTGVEQFHSYIMKEKPFGIMAKEISPDEAEAGDIVQLSFNGKTFQHTPFIVEVKRSKGDNFSYDQIKICAHSFNSQNRCLDTYQWRKIRFIRILGCMEK